jgi:hypothetical protein
MKAGNWITIIGGAMLTVLPQIVSSVPDTYKDVATAGLAVVVALWHLYQPAPNSH